MKFSGASVIMMREITSDASDDANDRELLQTAPPTGQSEKRDSMPIKIPRSLPATETLRKENIFVMDEDRAFHQDIRPLRIAVLNLMPTKITTETQLIRLLSNSSLQIELTLLKTESHISKNTSAEHMDAFYKNFSEVRDQKFDGLVITGAPVENLDFEQVDYWNEICALMEWSKTHVYSTLHICWAAQAGLYYHHGIQKYKLDQKISGVYSHRAVDRTHPIMRGFDEEFNAPHSRYTEVRAEDICRHPDLQLLAVSEEAGVYIVTDRLMRKLYVTGHSEYDVDTLAKEYSRDVGNGLAIAPPAHYFPDDDPTKQPKNTWRAHANLLFSNWLNYYVYQGTPFNLDELC